MLFNIFTNDLTFFIKNSSLYNFADYNTITAFEKDITLFKETPQNEAEIAIQRFKDNFMIVNPGKFHAMVINRYKKGLLDCYIMTIPAPMTVFLQKQINHQWN